MFPNAHVNFTYHPRRHEDSHDADKNHDWFSERRTPGISVRNLERRVKMTGQIQFPPRMFERELTMIS
jgi:hypothetical protein